MSHPYFPEVSRPTPSQATSYATPTPFDMVGPRHNSLYPMPGVLFPPIIRPPNLTFPSNHSTAPALYGTHGHAPTYQGQPALQQSTAPALSGTHGHNFTQTYHWQGQPAQSNNLLPNAVGQVLPLHNANIHASSYTLPDMRVGNHSAAVPPLEDTTQQETPAPFSFQFPAPSQTLETPWQAGGQQDIPLTEEGLATDATPVAVAPAGVPRDDHPTEKQVLDFLSVHICSDNKTVGCLGTGAVCLYALEVFRKERPDIELTDDKFYEYVIAALTPGTTLKTSINGTPYSAVVPPLEDTTQQETPAPFSFQFQDPSQTLEFPWQAGGQQGIPLTKEGLADPDSLAEIIQEAHPTAKQGAVFVAPEWLLDDSQNNEPAVLSFISVHMCSDDSMGCLGTGPVCLNTLEAFRMFRPDVELTLEKLCGYIEAVTFPQNTSIDGTPHASTSDSAASEHWPMDCEIALPDLDTPAPSLTSRRSNEKRRDPKGCPYDRANQPRRKMGEAEQSGCGVFPTVEKDPGSQKKARKTKKLAEDMEFACRICEVDGKNSNNRVTDAGFSRKDALKRHVDVMHEELNILLKDEYLRKFKILEPRKKGVLEDLQELSYFCKQLEIDPAKQAAVEPVQEESSAWSASQTLMPWHAY